MIPIYDHHQLCRHYGILYREEYQHYQRLVDECVANCIEVPQILVGFRDLALKNMMRHDAHMSQLENVQSIPEGLEF